MRSATRLFAALLTVLALWIPASASAASTYSDTISGFEYYATSTEGMFAGGASGSLPGDWNADVHHGPLCLSCSVTATITGGSFSLATSVNGIPTLVTGTFIGGTVQVTNVGPNCTNQTFEVNGTLASVGPWYSGSGSGTFATKLTHYRHPLFGRCITYGASIAGTLSPTF